MHAGRLSCRLLCTTNLLCSMDNHSQQLHSGQLQAIVADVVTCHRRLLFLLALVMAQIAQLCYQIFAPTTCIPHYTSILSGEAWVLELITGHPDCIKINFGISVETFWHLYISFMTTVLWYQRRAYWWRSNLESFCTPVLLGSLHASLPNSSSVQWTQSQSTLPLLIYCF